MKQRTELSIEAIVGQQPLHGSLELGRETLEREVLVPGGTRDTNTPGVLGPLVFNTNVVMEHDQGDSLALTSGEVQEGVTSRIVAEGAVDEARPSHTLWRDLGSYDNKDKYHRAGRQRHRCKT